MYTRKYQLICEGNPVMERFRIIGTQGLTFQQLMKKYNVKQPGFIEATDDFFDNTRWDITTTWEDKQAWENAQKHPYAKMFWNRFTTEAFKHEINLIVTDGDTGEKFEPLAWDD